MAIQLFIKKTLNIDVITFNKMKYLIVLIMTFNASLGNAQIIYPPNYSFEDDTNYVNISPWKSQGDFSFVSSVNMNFPPHGQVALDMSSVKRMDTTINTYIYNTFSINLRPKYLEYFCMYSASDLRDKFKTKLKLFKNDINGNPISICELDSMMDTSTFFFNYRPNWVHVKIPLEKYYLNELIPDSCYLEINAGLFFNLGFNNGHSLSIDKITLTGTAFVSVPKYYIDPENIILFPNPTSNKVKIDYKGKEKIQRIEIIDVLGRTVITQNANSNQLEIDVSCLRPGNYIMKIIELNGVEYSEKLIIEDY